MLKFSDLFHLDIVFTDIDVSSKEDALKRISDTLVEKEYVKEGYYDMLIEREKEYPTGLSTKPFEVAIPHTDPLHVLKPCIAVMKLQAPVTFTEMTKTGEVAALYIFVLVVKNQKDQVPLLQEFMKLLSDEEYMSDLAKADSPGDVLSVLTKVGHVN